IPFGNAEKLGRRSLCAQDGFTQEWTLSIEANSKQAIFLRRIDNFDPFGRRQHVTQSDLWPRFHLCAISTSNWRRARWKQTSNSSKKLTCSSNSGTSSARVQAKTSGTDPKSPTRT